MYRSPRSAPRHATRLLFLALILLITACGDRGGESGIYADWRSEEVQEGDTVVVRTLEGSVWGDSMVLVPMVAVGELEGEEPYLLGSPDAVDLDSRERIWVADGQAAEIRVFDREGRYLFTVGGRGGGPGEFTRPDDLRVTPGDEVIVRDQQGARFSVFSPEGEFLRSWPLQGGFSTSTGFHLDRNGQVRHPTIRNVGAEIGSWRTALAVFESATGMVVDTVDVPTRDIEAPFVEVRNEGSISRNTVPFTSGERWALTPEGTPIYLFTGRPRWERWNPDGTILAVERVAEAAPVAPGERADHRERITRGFRRIDPAWRWQGIDIPDTKPFFRGITVGVDGSVWLYRHVQATEVENPDWTPMSPEGTPRTVWQEPDIFDVFDPDGRYMGPVSFPEGFVRSRKSRFSLDEVLAVVTHPLGHEQVVRYRVEGREARTP